MMRQLSTYSFTASTHVVWPIIHVTHNLYSPQSIPNLFRNWLWGIYKNTRFFILVAAAALIWVLWLCKNDVVLTNRRYFLHCHSYLLVYTLAPYLACTAVSRPQEALYDGICTKMERATMEVFSKHGWCCLRICLRLLSIVLLFASNNVMCFHFPKLLWLSTGSLHLVTSKSE